MCQNCKFLPLFFRVNQPSKFSFNFRLELRFVMRNKTTLTKATVFKIIYLIFSLLVAAYAAYLLLENLIKGVKAGVTFDDSILLIAGLIALLFQSSIVGFIIRSFKAPTILMKNLVFKNDGTPYLPGLIGIAIAAVITTAIAVVVFVSAYIVNLLNMDKQSQCFILSFLLIVCVNFLFTTFYFFTFRHESGSFTII